MSAEAAREAENAMIQDTFISKLQSWLSKQPNRHARVSDAAHHLGVPTERIEQAACDGYWLGLDRYDEDVPYVFVDGD